GLAALDEWDHVRAEWMAVAAAYRAALPASNRLRYQAGFGESWIASTCVVELATAPAADAEAALGQAGISTRRWWGAGAAAHAARAGYARAALPVTEALARSTIGLPFSRDLGKDEIRRIADGIMAVMADSNALSPAARYG